MSTTSINPKQNIVVEVKPKQKGTATLSSYSDVTSGTLQREFRIVEDGIFYTDWQQLNSQTIVGVTLKQNNSIQIRYTNTSSSVIAEFESITFSGDFQAEEFTSPILDKSIFSNIAWTDETKALAKNLFKKLYFRGIIPMYIQRGDNVNADEDRDYIDLFYSIAKFFAIIFRLFKRFESFYDDEEMMLEHLRQNGIQFDESTITLEQLQLLANNLYDEIRKRGTNMIFKRQGDVVNGEELKIDGEFIRLIRSEKDNELLMENIPFYKMGWCLGSSSPLYRGTAQATELNKTLEETQSIYKPDLCLTFPKKEAGKESRIILADIVDDIFGNGIRREQVIRMQMPEEVETAENVGIGRPDGEYSDEDLENLIVADPCLDYEITFAFRTITPGDAKLYFGVDVFDTMKERLDNSLTASNSNEITNMFMSDVPLTKFINDQWYYIRGIIHAYSSRISEDAKLNIGRGHNLIFNNKFIKYLVPKIYITASEVCMAEIWDYKIRPLVRGTNILKLKGGIDNSHSLGFVQAPQIFYMYFRNNNNAQSESAITDIIERYLLPFNVTDILQFIDNDE